MRKKYMIRLLAIMVIAACVFTSVCGGHGLHYSVAAEGSLKTVTADNILYECVTDLLDPAHDTARVMGMAEGIDAESVKSLAIAEEVVCDGKAYPVTAIGLGDADPFTGLSHVRHITIPKSVTFISENAFSYIMQESDLCRVRIHGYIDSTAQDFSDSHDECMFVPVDGVSYGGFRVKFPEAAIGKFEVEYLPEAAGVAVMDKKCYDEDHGGWLFTLFADDNDDYKDSKSIKVIKQTGSMTYSVMFADDDYIDDEDYSDEVKAEYQSLKELLTDFSELRVPEIPSKSGIKSYKWKSGGKLSVKMKSTAEECGYQVQYSRSKKFKFGENGFEQTADWPEGDDKPACDFYKMSRGRAYLRVRTYRVIWDCPDGAYVYGEWSKVKKISY